MTPLQQSLLHLPGIGPVRAGILQNTGIACWQDILNATPENFPFPASLGSLQRAARENIDADSRDDAFFFIQRLTCQDRWRLLHKHWRQCVFLDIETAGLDADAEITVISCWDGNTPRFFVNGENLEDFPDYALTIPFLVTFNGATFDIPVIRRYFNIPELPVPHVDMRWICHRCSLDGGLKSIERQLDIQRPPDVTGTDGQEAIDLWDFWRRTRGASARAKLLRYCAADTIALQHVAAIVLQRQSGDLKAFELDHAAHWKALDDACPPADFTLTTAMPKNTPPAGGTPAQAATSQLSALQQRLRQFLDRKRK